MNINCENISVSLNNNNILKNVSVEIKANKFVGIIGPNGSGKTTLLKCIYRVLKANEGTIYLDNENLWDMSFKKSARCISVVAQHNFYNFDFTVKEIVLMGRAPYKKNMEFDNENDIKLVEKCLELVGLNKFYDRSFNSLSGGEQQRVVLARAIAQQTKCMILDEPINHLDIKYQLQLMNIVRSLGVTVVAALHDINIATMYCDFIYIVKNGNIVAKGDPHEILTKELLYDIYEVNVDIVKDKNGKAHIIYCDD